MAKLKGYIQKEADPECEGNVIYTVDVYADDVKIVDTAVGADYEKLNNNKVVLYDADADELGTYYAESWDYEDVSREDANAGIGDEYDDNRL